MRTNRELVITTWVPLARVRMSERRRRGIDASTVERYREWLEGGLEPPPVRLVRQGDGFVVRDGRHRVAAALAAGHREIGAELAGSATPARALAILWSRIVRLIERRRRAAARSSPVGT